MSKDTPTTFESVCIERVFAAIEAATGHTFCFHIVARLAGRVDEMRMVRSIRLALDAEPVLRCRFVEGWFQPYWKFHELLEEDQFFQVIETESEPETLQDVFARDLHMERECGVKVFLLRGLTDILCVKFNHKLGDGETGKQFTYRLAETYSRLTLDPQYVPPAQPPRDRSVMQITRHMSANDQRRVLRKARPKKNRPGEFADWQLPRPAISDGGLPARCFVVKQISARQNAAILDYARRHGVTRNTILLAAYARAAVNAIPRSSGRRSEIQQTVDLRRHLDKEHRSYHCNLSSMITLTVEQSAADPLDRYVAGLGDQMDAARKEHMGLTHPLIRWELNPKRRFLFNCIPFRVIKRAARRRVRRLERSESPGRVVFSNVGTIDREALVFGGVKADDAYIISGTLAPGEFLLLLATEFDGRLTFSIGFSPRFVDGGFLEEFLEEVVRNLPA